MKPFGTVMSGIDKQTRSDLLFVSFQGLPDDEHDLTFHGGPDKAIHQYCSDHYPLWQEMYPDKEVSSKFVPGGFGENLVADGLSEDSICAGDLIRIGLPGETACGGQNGCLLEVSLPRQPCFKLNQRFGIKNFAPRTHQLARTGWYYRVKEEGWISPGMEIRVVERPYPQWTISRLHHAVHREKTFTPEMNELLSMAQLGDECKDVFVTRLEKHEEDQRRANAPKTVWKPFKLATKSLETTRIARLSFTSTPRSKPTKLLPGSSVTLRLPNGLQRSYSIVSGTTDSFVLGVARDEQSRGGSIYLHDSLHVGDSVEVGEFMHNLELHKMASHHIFIVGGIGITAFLAMMDRLNRTNQTFELHNAVRSAQDIAFASALEPYASNTRVYDRSKGQRMDIKTILQTRIWNSHVYVCGPQRMIDAVLQAARDLDIPDEEVHFEQFKVDQDGDPFTVDVESPSGIKSLEVGERQSLLEAMRDAGFEVPSSCETGGCGTCQLPLLGGRVEHRGTYLTDEERQTKLLSCVSRGIGRITVGVADV
jgi:MOSC domain-containing protein YiiM/ferredoxin-NADP reductase